MNRKLWDLYAPIYKRAMKADQHIYEFMIDFCFHIALLAPRFNFFCFRIVLLAP